MKHSPPEPKHLLRLSALLCSTGKWTEGKISNRIVGGGRLFERLREITPKTGRPRTCSISTYLRALSWFSENWPDEAGLKWPSDIPRPVKSSKREAA